MAVLFANKLTVNAGKGVVDVDVVHGTGVQEPPAAGVVPVPAAPPACCVDLAMAVLRTRSLAS